MPVGGFPGLLINRKKTVRAPVNPMDKCTVVSIYPRKIKERKPTIQPCLFEIAPGSLDKPELLVVGPSSWWKEIDEEQPLLEIPNSSMQVANAIVRDFCNGLICCDMGKTMPGLFYLTGEVKLSELKDKYKNHVAEANNKQNAWFQALVKMTDALWAKTNGNPLVIAEEARMAAGALGLRGKDWMKDFTMLEQTPCVACGMPRNPIFPVCPHCHAVVDTAKAKELGIVFAQK